MPFQEPRGVMIHTWIQIDIRSLVISTPDRFEDDTQSSVEAANNLDVFKRDNFAFWPGRRVYLGMHLPRETCIWACLACCRRSIFSQNLMRRGSLLFLTLRNLHKDLLLGWRSSNKCLRQGQRRERIWLRGNGKLLRSCLIERASNGNRPR